MNEHSAFADEGFAVVVKRVCEELQELYLWDEVPWIVGYSGGTTTPSCGSSRFGCWTCTLVDQDRSMEAMIKNDDEKLWMTPLLEFRNELGDFKNEATRRDYRRMNGNVFLGTNKTSGDRYLVRGPYRPKWRQYWLQRLLEVQKEIREIGPPEVAQIELITMEELHEIRRIWLHEKHEFEDAVPVIYQQATGKVFECVDADDRLLGREEWSILNEICGDDDDFLQLQMQLLDIERKYRSMSRRSGVFDDLESCLKKAQFENEAEAIAARQDQEERRRRIEDPNHNPMPQTGLLFDLDEFDDTEVFQIGEGNGV